MDHFMGHRCFSANVPLLFDQGSLCWILKNPRFSIRNMLGWDFWRKTKPPILWPSRLPCPLNSDKEWVSGKLYDALYDMGHISQQSNFFFKTLIGSKKTLPTSHWNPLKEAPAPPLSLTSRPLLLKLEECDSRQRVIFLSPAWVIFFKTIYLADVAVCRIQTKTKKYNAQNLCCVFCICMNV